ncbi:ubiquitin-protein ligase peroxin 12 NDAI_0B01460 [Naumovozyma dairenensis CBS 421]|uniref:Peroxisome assembly protein 12 n=1 Tax=Naumovozyma dairenensis (strain ATCC 10597 / BCRC 20456 / CBS 421 / NBRC 0211 / NRRL Y-12639) TaxID=1071378 RepID=G0W5W9_NAUDC|nr:hypothetical protein NDAI_0B01460 [Naumovozyma dairenensis CBS 421]CCD23180.1 hypothetical protein NDAI_0B01460 [Naumovozyma dairenensis CBS 421]
MSFYSNLPTSSSTSTSTSTPISKLYPTVFEIFSSQEIDALLPDSVRYILTNYWIARHPTKFTLSVNNYFDEWFNLILKGLVEWYHLKRFNSTFVDKFYGLQRFSSANTLVLNSIVSPSTSNFASSSWPIELQLTKVQRLIILLQKIIIPYLKNKLDVLYNKYLTRLTFNNSKDENDTPTSLRVKKIFINVYPIWKKCWNLMDIIVKLSFLTGKTGSISIMEYLFNIQYTRMTPPLQQQQQQLRGKAASISTDPDERIRKLNKYSFLNESSKILSSSKNALSFVGSQMFPSFIFMLRVYQWWTTEDLTTKLQKRIDNLDEVIPKPPIANDKSIETTNHYHDKECPICHSEIQNPCVIETGYVLCYPCAIKYLTENEGKCPITHKKVLGCQFDPITNQWQVNNGIRKLLI